MSVNGMNKEMIKSLSRIKCALLILSLAIPGLALAARDTNPICNGSNIAVNISFGTVAVQRDAAVGEVLATAQTGVLNGGSSLGGCQRSPYSASSPPSFFSEALLFAFTTPSTLGANIYDTNIAGVGIRITFNGANNENTPLPFDKTYPMSGSVPGKNITIELIKTASNIATGTLQTGELAQQNFYYDPSNKFTGWVLSLTGTNRVQQVACSVSNKVINVPMGDVKNIDFKGSGTTTGEKSFAIPLSCDAGTKVNVTLEAGSSGSYDASLGIINLDSSGQATATGIGLQILNNSTPVTLGELISIGSTASEGGFNVPLTARYIQTGSSVTPGTANATATFTMTYK